MQLICFHLAGQQARASVSCLSRLLRWLAQLCPGVRPAAPRHVQPVLGAGAGLRRKPVWKIIGLRGWSERASPGLAAAWLWKVKVPEEAPLSLCPWPGCGAVTAPRLPRRAPTSLPRGLHTLSGRGAQGWKARQPPPAAPRTSLLPTRRWHPPTPAEKPPFFYWGLPTLSEVANALGQGASLV